MKQVEQDEKFGPEGAETANDALPAITYYVLPETPCPYMVGRFERKLMTEIAGASSKARYDLLTRAGFRRSHRFAYRPACQDCSACIPVRISTLDFKTSESFNRVWRTNRDLLAIERAAVAMQEHYALFKSYLRARHRDGEMAIMGPDDFRSMVEESDLDTQLIEFRRSDRSLLGGLLLDWVSDGASAVYSYFAPAEKKRSLGTYMILWLVEEARKRGLPYVYLGYWIDDCQKMNYKTRFQPTEALGPAGWQPLEK